MTEEQSAGLAEAVAELVEPVYRSLEVAAARVRLIGDESPDGQLSEPALQPVADLLISLVADEPLAAGMGFVADAGAVSGQERFMSWWQRTPGDRVARLRLNFDPSSVDVYDYLQMEWFQQARGRDRVVYGPYVDYSGSEMYVVTMTVPVHVHGRFVGVVGADLGVNEVERQLVAVLRRVPRDAVLVNAERRVLATNTPRWVVGTRLAAAPEVDDEFGLVQEVPNGTGWVVAVARDRRRHEGDLN